MSAIFNIKNNMHKGLRVLLAGWFLMVAGICGIIQNTMKLPINKSFYFLVSTSTHVQATTHYVALTGGAGYLLEYNGREYVVFSMYLEKEDGLNVQASMLNEDTKLLTCFVDTLYLDAYKEKNKKEHLKSALNSLYGCLEVLEKCIYILSDGGTQESGKEILNILQKQLYFLEKEYVNVFPMYASLCQNVASKINQLKKGTLFLKDLRYLLCELAVGYLSFTENFAM